MGHTVYSILGQTEKKMPSTRQQLQPRVSTVTPRPWLRRVSRNTGAGQAQQRPEATQGEAQGEAHQPRNSSGGTWRQVQNLLKMKIMKWIEMGKDETGTHIKTSTPTPKAPDPHGTTPKPAPEAWAETPKLTLWGKNDAKMLMIGGVNLENG